MWITIRTGLLTLVGFVIASAASSEQLVYSHQFDQGMGYPSGSLQYDDWLSYRASLPESDIMSITVSGSRDPVGRTCSDPTKAQQIADAMVVGAVGQPAGTSTLNVFPPAAETVTMDQRLSTRVGFCVSTRASAC